MVALCLGGPQDQRGHLPSRSSLRPPLGPRWGRRMALPIQTKDHFLPSTNLFTLPIRKLPLMPFSGTRLLPASMGTIMGGETHGYMPKPPWSPPLLPSQPPCRSSASLRPLAPAVRSGSASRLVKALVPYPHLCNLSGRGRRALSLAL